MGVYFWKTSFGFKIAMQDFQIHVVGRAGVGKSFLCNVLLNTGHLRPFKSRAAVFSVPQSSVLCSNRANQLQTPGRTLVFSLSENGELSLEEKSTKVVYVMQLKKRKVCQEDNEFFKYVSNAISTCNHLVQIVFVVNYCTRNDFENSDEIRNHIQQTFKRQSKVFSQILSPVIFLPKYDLDQAELEHLAPVLSTHLQPVLFRQLFGLCLTTSLKVWPLLLVEKAIAQRCKKSEKKRTMKKEI